VIVSFQNSEQKLTKFVKCLKFPQIPAENSIIPGNSRGNSWGGRFPGIPGREFPVALDRST